MDRSTWIIKTTTTKKRMSKLIIIGKKEKYRLLIRVPPKTLLEY
jgi:hypothetical protein